MYRTPHSFATESVAARRHGRSLSECPLVFLLLLLCSSSAAAQEPAALFRQSCMSCHTIGGGRLTGPDLKDVEQRTDRAWLVQFLLDPPAMIARGDPYALKLQQESRGVVMPKIAGIDRARAEALLDLIRQESRLPESQFKGVQIGDRPFTPQDIARGRAIFSGTQKLTNGGPACSGCHSIAGLAGLGGGRLGPDLTKVFERLQGRKNLSAWLAAPATTTMQPLFQQTPLTSEEVVSLVAFFEDASKNNRAATTVGLLYFFLIAVGGTVLGLVVFDTAWKHRLRGVRRTLLRRGKEEEAR